MTVLRPTSSLKKTKEPESAQAGPNETCLAGAPTTARWPAKGTSLSRLASGVLRAASSMPWSGGPAGDGRSSCSKDPRRGGEPPSSATFLGGRDWEKRSLETAAPWNTGRVSRLISWGHWGETGTVWCGVHRSSPEGPALKSPGPLASGHSSRRLLFLFENVIRRSVFGPGAPLWLRLLWGVQEVTFLNEELEHDWSCSAQQPQLTTSTSSEEER